MHQARWSVTGRHLATVQRPLACFLLSDRLKETSDYWSVQGQRGNLFGRQSVSGNLHKMLITLSPALQLSLSVSDCEWLSHCSALYHSPRGATGTKGGTSCRFKRMCSAQLVRLLLGLSFFFSSIYAVIEKLLQMYYREQCCQSIEKGSLLSKSVFILPVLATSMWDSWNKITLCVQLVPVQNKCSVIQEVCVGLLLCWTAALVA